MTTDTVLCIGLEDGTIQLWDLEKLEADDAFPTATAHTSKITCLHKYDHFLISGDASGEIKVWDFE